MNIEDYQNFFNDLNLEDIKCYLEKDPFLIQKMKEVFQYILNYDSLPTRKKHFSCVDISMLDWIYEIRKIDDVLFQKFSMICFSYKIHVYGTKIWNLKFHDFFQYVKENRKLPEVNKISFFDGTDMRKWYLTQLRRKKNKSTKCVLLAEEQIRKLDDLEVYLFENQILRRTLTNTECLKELYQTVLELKRFPFQSERRFSDGSNMGIFVKKLRDHTLELTEEESLFYYKILEYTIRVNKDGEKNVTPSNGSFMAYFRKRMHVSENYMAEMLGMSYDYYHALEYNKFSLYFMRMMQYIVLIDRVEMQDSFLDLMSTTFKSRLLFSDQLTYLLVKLSAMFSLKCSLKTDLKLEFYKRFHIRNCDIPTWHFSVPKKIAIYRLLEEILVENSIFADEKETILSIMQILKQDILDNSSVIEIINKTNISLGIKCGTISSVYTLSCKDATSLLEFYENFRLCHSLDDKQMEFFNTCCYLLSCVVSPGTDLVFEVLRLKEKLGMKVQDFSCKFGIPIYYLAHMHTQKYLSKKVCHSIISSLSCLDDLENEDIERFKNVFFEYSRRTLEK